MIPKPIYETLPYGCFLIGSLAWLLGESLLVVLPGVVLYCLGAQLWVLRTGHRRRDRVAAKLVDKSRSGELKPSYRRWVWPSLLYEAMPFIYIAIAYGILTGRETQMAAYMGVELLWLSALVLLLVGFMVLLLRGLHRRRASTVKPRSSPTPPPQP